MANGYQCGQCNEQVENGDLAFITNGVLFHRLNGYRKFLNKGCDQLYTDAEIAKNDAVFGLKVVFYEGKLYGIKQVVELLGDGNVKLEVLSDNRGVRIIGDLAGLEKSVGYTPKEIQDMSSK